MLILFFLIVTIIALTGLAPHWSILTGVLFSLTLTPPELVKQNGKKWSSLLLKISIVLLGAGLNFQTVLKEGTEGILITAVSISCVFMVGMGLAKIMSIPSPLSTLVTAGTAICGGSAIAAISPILKSSNLIIAASLGIVFILNAVSVFIFPPIGHFFQLTQEQFGTWAALAIHDTSSVVAASQIYGKEALITGTTLKLTRALWIIPLSLIFATVKKTGSKMTVPWFIFFFLVMSLLFTVLPELSFMVPTLSKISKTGLSMTLFLIGLELNKNQLREIGLRPIIFGIVLWLLTASGSLTFVLL